MGRFAFAILVLLAAGCSQPLPEQWFGAYRLSDGRLISIRDGTRRYGNHHADYFRTEIEQAQRHSGLTALAAAGQADAR